jgi:hypothetical protein
MFGQICRFEKEIFKREKKINFGGEQVGVKSVVGI